MMAPRTNDLQPGLFGSQASRLPQRAFTGQQPELATTSSFEALPDEDLALRAVQDRAAFEELYRRYRLPIYRYHVAWTGDEQAAQSLTSQTFLAALERIASYQFGGPFLRWFFGIASQLRREALSVLPDNAAAPDPAAVFHSGFAEIARALEVLRQDMAEAVLLRIFAGFSSSEVGLIMLKSDTAVKALVYEGLLGLSERLAWNLEVEDD